jgi:transcriptional regulator with XRE-family HTH domain
MQLKGLTQKELAGRMNKKSSKINKWLKGNHNLTLKTIAKLEAELGESIIHVVESKIKKETIETEDPVQKKIDALLKKAQESKISSKKVKSNKPSSLHQIIKTKEQADRFMKQLREA